MAAGNRSSEADRRAAMRLTLWAWRHRSQRQPDRQRFAVPCGAGAGGMGWMLPRACGVDRPEIEATRSWHYL